MITQAVQGWRDFANGASPAALDQLLADDVVFYSPIVHTPQRGKAITAQYLLGARAVFGGMAERGGFHFLTEVIGSHTAMLEFETTIGDTYVNGVDLIRCNEAGQISEFRVFVRPWQAVNAVYQEMATIVQNAHLPS